MENRAIQILEAAAQVLMASPSAVTPEQRHEAEAIFLDFRKTLSPYQLCRDILERSSSDYVLFEAVGLLKDALIREWSALSKDDALSMRHFLFKYVLEKNLAPFVRQRILQTISIIVKRGSIEDEGRDRQLLLAELAEIIVMCPPETQQVACGLIQSLLQEFAVTVKSSDIGILWETHYRLKKQFERIDLKIMFRFAVESLGNILRGRQPLEGSLAVLVRQLLCITETILCWGQVVQSLPKRLIGALETVHESDSSPALRLTQNWRDTILEPDLLAMFFNLHRVVRNNPDLLHHSLTCLVQFASLSGSVLSGNNAMLEYYQNYIKLLLEMLSSTQLNEREMLAVSDMFRKLLLFFPINKFVSLENHLPEAILRQLTSVTCHCIRASAQEEERTSESYGMSREALSRILDAWSQLLQHREPPRVLPLKQSAVEVFNTYLQCRLAPPAGTRSIDDNGGGTGGEEEDERSWHSATLQVVGALSRRAADHSIPLITNLITDRTQKLVTYLQQHQPQALLQSHRIQMFNLFDDLHWLIMIAGYVVCSECCGETGTMPFELLAISSSTPVSVEQSLQLLVGEKSTADNADCVVALVSSILRLSEFETRALQAGGTVAAQALSPELSATCSWFFCHWAYAYLMPNLEDYNVVSTIWEEVWGLESLGAAWIVNNLLMRVLAILNHLSTEPTARTQATDLLIALASIKDKKGRAASSEALWSIVAWERNTQQVPGEVRRSLYRAFMRAAANADDDTRNRLLRTSVALNERLSTVTSGTLSDSSLFADVLDSYIGIAEGSQVRTVDAVFEVLLPALDAAPSIVDRYHNCPEIVFPTLHLLVEVSRRMLSFLNQTHTNRFYTSCLDSISVYSKWNQNKLSSLTQDLEEDPYQDVVLIIELISGVLSKESLEMAYSAGGSSNNGNDAVGSGNEVCLRSLRLLMPLVVPQLLSFPLPAMAFYRMIRDIEPTQVCLLPPEDVLNVVNALRVGLTTVSSDVTSQCCDAIAGIAAKAKTLGDDRLTYFTQLLVPICELLITSAFKRELSFDSVGPASGAIYSVACLSGDVSVLHNVIVRDFISSYSSDAAVTEKLRTAFNELIAGVNFDGQRPSKLKFRDNFDRFLVAVHNSIYIL